MNDHRLDRTQAQRKSVTRILAKVRTIAKELRERGQDALAVVNLAGAANALADAENYLLTAETRMQDAEPTERPAA